ncbi:synaptonemal complex protein ZIP1-like [Vicia villosa]|uniref:synaptonemal complex protein ZIP1-like n=1 Tax=Vicia villosa TaxID=3911 RepID=UPI00273BE7CE|nr:synaptonemal complex protein ZIP1-like [Vicia villosa]
MEGGDMDSLFEGMVLFNPTQTEDTNNHADGNNSQATDEPPVSSSSQPLDEDIFSDLTLVVDPDDDDLQSQPSQHQQHSSSSSSSRRRKRPALRIGYGRHTVDADPSPPPAFPASPLDDSMFVADTRDVSVANESITSDAAADVSVAGESINSDDAAVSVATESINADVDVATTAVSSVSVVTQPSDESESRQSVEVETFSEEGFRKIKDTIHEKLNHARQLVSSASSARKDAVRSRRKALENANLASLKYMELENQLEEACEAEDFERAEKVSEDLSVAEKEKQVFASLLKEADAFLGDLDLKLQHALESHIGAEEECAILLQNYAMNAVNNADFSMKKATSVHSKEMEQWLSSSEALEVKRMELEIESHFISEAHTELNNNIEHSIEDDKKEKEILCKRKSVLMGELENLLALVKQKEKEIADNDSDLKAVEYKINNVVSGFKEIQSTIDVKNDELQSVLAQVKLETETLSLKKDEIDNFLVREEGMGAKLREFARLSEEEAKGYMEIVKLRRSLMSYILKSGEDKLRLTNNEEKLSGEVKLFQQEVSAARASLQELSSRKSSIQQDIASFKQRITFIDKRLPELEAEKKVATAARNFKEAARIATEAKSLSVEKEDIQTEMDTATSNLEKLEEEIKGTFDKLQETEGMILLKEKELAMAKYQKLLLTAATARAEKKAAQEMGDAEEANLLLAEAEAADREAERIRSTYDFKAEDVSNLPKDLISMDLVSIIDQKQLEKLAITSSV